MELLDLYTSDRVRTGNTIERGNKIPQNFYRLVTHVCIFNSRGEMLIQHRQSFKKGWSNMWDLTAGGSALAGDTSQKSIERELSEELGLEISFEGERPAIIINFDEGFDDIYVLERDIDISTLNLQYEEVKEVRWASLDEVHKMLDDGSFLPYHKSLIELLFFMRNHRGARIRKDNTSPA